MSFAVVGRSAVFTQHVARVSAVKQFEPLQAVDFLLGNSEGGKGSELPTTPAVQVEFMVFNVALAQLNSLVSAQV